MNLRTYIQTLQAHLSACSPDLGDEDAILGVLYEAYSESNAMYNDEIKSAFHTLYEAMNGYPCGRWIKSSIRFAGSAATMSGLAS